MDLPKSATGIQGLDELTGGGLPALLPHAGVRQRGLRQDAAQPGVPDPRRAASLRRVEGPRRRSGAERNRGLPVLKSCGMAHTNHIREYLRRRCAEDPDARHRLAVTDRYQQPELAPCEQVVALPALIKRLPVPLRSVVGGMSSTERVLVGLDPLPRAPRVSHTPQATP